MSSIPIICMVCSASIKDTQFVTHMNSVHGGLSQPEAMIAEKNIPKQQAPIVLDKEAPPSDDFMEVAKMLDEKPKDVPPVPKPVEKTPARNVSSVQEERKIPLQLRYQWEGNCPNCNTPVKTITLKAKGQTVCVAYCLTHSEVRQREVADLGEKEIIPKGVFLDHASLRKAPKEQIIRKEVKKRDKRSKSVIQHKATVQSTMPTAGLPRN